MEHKLTEVLRVARELGFSDAELLWLVNHWGDIRERMRKDGAPRDRTGRAG